MFKTDYKSNRQTLQLLKKQLQTFSKGKDTLYVNGYSGECDNDSRNRRTVFHRCNNLKGYLINYYGLRERDFKTVTTPHNHPDLGDIVVISYSSLPLLRQMEEDVSKSLPAEKERKTGEITPVVVEKETEPVREEQDIKEEIQQAEQQTAVAASSRSQDIRTAARWYAGIELGMPLGVSAFTSFASGGKAGFEGGVLGGYRISPLLSVEAGISAGTMRLGASKCCSDYWLGADGVRYLEHVAGMDSYSYKDIYSSVSVQQYALRLNVDLLQIVRPNWDKRWSLTVSPAIYGIGTQATLKENGTKTTIVKRNGRFRFGAGAAIGGSYQVTGNLGIGLRSGVVWVSGGRFDGITPTDHKENMIWNNTMTLIWRFGSNQ
jgi:putative peptidoglycan-associated lipoprotein